MNGLRTCLAALLLVVGSAPRAEDAPSDEALTLATCQARYTAVLQHAWLIHGDIEAARMRRDLFAAMLAASLSDNPDRFRLERRLLTHRVAQKHATGDLLTTARFGTDARRARIARTLLTRQLAVCDRLLIGRAPIGT